MRGPPASPLLLLPVLLQLAAATQEGGWVGSSQTDYKDVAVESYPGGFTRPANLALLCLVCAVVVVLGVAVVTRICLAGSTPLSFLLFSTQLVAALTAGTCTWVVTYSATREALEDQSARLLIFAGRTAIERTSSDLATGVVAVQQNYDAATKGFLDVTAGYPHVHRRFVDMDRSLGRMSQSILAFYFGSEEGHLQGIQRAVVEGKINTSRYTLWAGVGPRRCQGGVVRGYGTPNSTCREAVRELRCPADGPNSQCTYPACSTPEGGCAHCLTHLGTVQDDPDRCPGCRPCPEWRHPKLEEYIVSADPEQWDLPPTAGQETGFCQLAPRAAVENARNVTMAVYGDRGTEWVGGPVAVLGCSFSYDPRGRPWYNRTAGLQWSPVYQFTSEGLALPIAEIGITVTRAVPNPSYRGTPYLGGTPADPRDNPWLAVLAVDFSFTTLSAFLSTVKPSENSIILLAATDGTLCGGSLPRDQLVKVTTDEDGVEKFGVENVISPTFRYRYIYLEVVEQFGSLAAAARRIAIFQAAEASMLNQPIELEQGPVWTMVTAMPWKDIFADADSATTGALIIGICISVAAGVAVFIVVRTVLRPLHQLTGSMQQVSVMKLEVGQVSGGVTTEVCSMAQSFDVMVRALREYRSYLPEVVLQGKRSAWDVSGHRAPKGTVCIVFTDIVGSTKLWESAPAGMSEALLQHDELIRDQIYHHGGYEVKTIGDSFMVAFGDPAAGVAFSVRTQENLLEAKWLSDAAMAAVSPTWEKADDGAGNPVWNGITVRIGVSWGPAQHELNPMTERTDYRGRIVNLAARLEGTCPIGTVHVSEDCFAAVSGDHRVADIRFHMRPHQTLKGIGEVTTYVAVTPKLIPRYHLAVGTPHQQRWAQPVTDSSLKKLPRTRSVSAARELETTSRAELSQVHTSASVAGMWENGPNSPPAPSHAHTSEDSSFDSGSQHRAAGRPASMEISMRAPNVLSQKHASVAAVTDLDEGLSRHARPQDDVDAVGRLMLSNTCQTIYAAARSQGSVGPVLGSMIQVTWNVVNPCGEHATQVLYFASALQQVRVAIGAGSGSLQAGFVGTNRTKSHTVVGLVVQASLAAADEARAMGTLCLAVFDPRPPDSITHTLRPVDTWGCDAEGSEVLTVEELLLDRIVEVQSPWHGESPAVCPGRSDPTRALYFSALRQGDADAVAELRAMVSDDRVLRAVVQRLEQHIAQHPQGAPYRRMAPFHQGRVSPVSCPVFLSDSE
eukprot:TRINITY_DN2863_c3_g1_i1.p1 TRINITY_DN2863_c3_g1~~TRINITY_DN2863_c3_g1_i1.p1  ORF type:complete len:1265 (+),score=247.29 TRINITY_DN2863_c3_g1_i1:80-3796(+)